jgi:hypothetical protein
MRVECTHCRVPMTPHAGQGSIQYFRCGSCERWVSSAYAEVLSAGANFRTRPAGSSPERKQEGFEAVKERLERWLAALEEGDPYRVLNVSPLDTDERVKARYHELALERHPDRGGSQAEMQRLNVAYERILRHRERQAERNRYVGAEQAEAVAVLPSRAR